MVAGILLKIAAIQNGKTEIQKTFKFACSWLVQVSQVNLKKRDHVYM